MNKYIIIITILLSFLFLNKEASAQTYPSCKSTKSGNNKHFITLVNFNQLVSEDSDGKNGKDEDGDGYKGYEDKTGAQTPLCVPSKTYTINVSIKDKSDDYIDGWIDWNNDGDFEDANEKFTQIADDVNSDGPYSGTITVPSNQTYFGKTRMRIAVRKDSRPPTNADANYSDEGEVEDFDIDVVRLKDKFYYVSDRENYLNGIDISNGEGIVYSENQVTNIEGITFWPSYTNPKLYASNGGVFGTINQETSIFTSIGEIDGGGKANGADGAQNLNDVDGIGFDARTGVLWASNRRSSDYDLLFQINPTTGHFVEDAFGNDIDYIIIDGSGIYQDFDDLSISPVNGEIYGVSYDGDSCQLLRVNPFLGNITIHTAITGATDIEGLAFSNNGTLYGTSGHADEIYSIDTSTGAATFLYDLLGNDVEGLTALMDKANRIRGTIWADINKDGIKDAGESTGISLTVELYYDVNNNGEVDSDDKLIQTTTSDASGNYTFEYATTGHLAIRILESSLPFGYALTTDNKEQADFSTLGNDDHSNNFGAYNGADCDSDGIPDFKEGTADSDGDGIQDKCDKDSDNDGIIDSEEGTTDTDGDGIPNYLDLDSDNDGIPDAIEANGGAAPTDYNSSTARIGGSDSDGDGIMNSVDDGSSSTLVNYDTDGDGIKDYKDLDSDNDGILDLVEVEGTDSDKNGRIDSFSDSNNDGYHDAYASSPLIIYNNDSATEVVNLPNYRDIDSDGDSIDDSREGYSPADYSVISIIRDHDRDGILNHYDKSVGGTSITPCDYDSDGVPDYKDLDSDNDGITDLVEGNDTDGDGNRDVNPSGTDVNKNGLDDAFDLDCKGASRNTFTASSRSEERNSNGDIDLGSSDIELTYEDHQQTVGVRYTGVTINQGATITAASILFQVDEVSTGSLSIAIEGEDVDNSAAFTSSDYDVSNRTTTTAVVNWSPADWNTKGDNGSDQKTSSIKTIIQEIIDRPGWSSGNSITIIFTSSDSNKRTAENTPILSISTSDGLKYDCGSDLALQDANSNSKQDWRDVDATLPVSLIDFSAKKVNDYVEINWTTASEKNNDYFVVQKSVDGFNFDDIDIVEGAGNSNVIINYRSYDDNPNYEINYYRLSQIDYDGTITLSSIVAVINESENIIQVFPNPSDGNITVKTQEAIDVVIYSSIGHEVLRLKLNANTNNKIDLTNHKKGIYFLSYITNGKRVVKKIIVI